MSRPMGILVYALDPGVVLVDQLTTMPLPLETCCLEDLDDADAFVEWASARCRVELRKASAETLALLGANWVSWGRTTERMRLERGEDAR